MKIRNPFKKRDNETDEQCVLRRFAIGLEIAIICMCVYLIVEIVKAFI